MSGLVWSCKRCGWYDMTVAYNTPQSHCPRCYPKAMKDEAKPEGRKPLLSDEWIEDGAEAGAVLTQLYHEDGRRDIWKGGYRVAMNQVRDLLTKGELMVVKVATMGSAASPWGCSNCGRYIGNLQKPVHYCPGCGAKIVQP